METIAGGAQNPWFYDFAGNRIGPLAPHEIRAAIASGRIQPDTPIRQLGSGDWQPARSTMFGPLFSGASIDPELAFATTVPLNNPRIQTATPAPRGNRLPSTSRLPLRVIAGVVDWMIFGGLYAFVLLLVLSAFVTADAWKAFNTKASMSGIDMLRHFVAVVVTALPGHLLTLALLSLLLFLGYFVALPRFTANTTFGKRGCGLRVVDVDGNPATAIRLIIRSLCLLLSGIVPGALTAFLHTHHRGLHDLVAGTQVVPEHEARVVQAPT